jgi:hypothetical protein
MPGSHLNFIRTLDTSAYSTASACGLLLRHAAQGTMQKLPLTR